MQDQTLSLKAIPLKQLTDGTHVILVPELAYLIQATTPVERVELDESTYKGIRSAYDSYKKDRFLGTKITNISIVPTGYCEGGCRYCYAKDGWKVKDYLSPKTLEATLKRQGIENLDSVIIYGGEPVMNWDGYAELIQYLVFDRGAKSISTSTSTFYPDETFQKLLNFIDHLDKRLSLSVSIDPEGENGAYMRRYAGKDTYRFIFNRLVEIIKHTHNVGTRQTLSRISPEPFKLSRELLAVTGFHVPTTLDYIKYDEKNALTDEQHQHVLDEVTAFAKEWYYTGTKILDVQMFSPFRKALEIQNLFSVMKGCDMGTARLAIMPDGNISDCTEDVKLGHPTGYTKDDRTFDRALGFPKACSACDFKYMCNMQCFQYLSGVDEHSRGQKLYCAFHQHCTVEGVKFWFSRMTDAEALEKVTNQALIGVVPTGAAVAP
ncbi:MAG: radical SAM/SPASM domain-containing protein [Phycisphaerae bacterium]|jgi:radical SAM protein with 4Fe4S-binding SPASM domain